MAQEGSSLAMWTNSFSASSYQNECSSATPRSKGFLHGRRTGNRKVHGPQLLRRQIFMMMAFIGQRQNSEPGREIAIIRARVSSGSLQEGV